MAIMSVIKNENKVISFMRVIAQVIAAIVAFISLYKLFR